MPGPRNSKKVKKQQAEKGKTRQRKGILMDIEQNVVNKPRADDTHETTIVHDAHSTTLEHVRTEGTAAQSGETMILADQGVVNRPETVRQSASHPAVPRDSPFIVDPGNGPRVKNIEAFLSSFFCPPLSTEDGDCMRFGRQEIVTVLESILPKEVALIVWYNKTRTYDRICPACQRLYRLGDTLADPVSNELIDVNNPRTPPHVLRERQLSGLCSFPCFFLACYSSQSYSAEVSRGAWGLLWDELDPQVRSLLDATDPRTAAFLRFGLAACTPSQLEELGNGPNDQGLGRVLRLTRRRDLGLGEVLEALAWYEKERANNPVDALRC